MMSRRFRVILDVEITADEGDKLAVSILTAMSSKDMASRYGQVYVGGAGHPRDRTTVLQCAEMTLVTSTDQAARVGPLSVVDWARERLANCEEISETRTGTDREGWLEDLRYWKEIITRLATT